MVHSSCIPLKLSSRPCNPPLHPDSLHCVWYKKLRWFICKQCVAVFFRVISKPKIIPCCAMYLLHWRNRRNCLSLYSDGMGVNRSKRLSPYNDRLGGVKVKLCWPTLNQKIIMAKEMNISGKLVSCEQLIWYGVLWTYTVRFGRSFDQDLRPMNPVILWICCVCQ